VAAAALVGVLADRLLAPPLWAWWLALIFVVVLCSALRRRPRAAAVSLWIGCGLAFAAWHHVVRDVVSPEMAAFLSDEPSRPIQLEARVVRPSWTQERPADHTVSTLAVLDRVHVVINDASPSPLEGRLRLIVENAVVDLPAGVRVRVVGRLVQPATAGNPGGFDFREWLRGQGVAALVRVDTPEALERLDFSPTWGERLQNQRRELRQAAVHRLKRSTAPETAQVAEALLLGSRQQMPEELRVAFMESGTLHVLAISGVNVGVIWLGLVRACRLLGFSLRRTGWTVIGGLLVYAWLTDANPPIVRAVSLAIVFQLAEILHRQATSLQGLSLALLVVLIANPQDLFHPGAQLSFLSVSALSVAQRWWERMAERESDVASAGVLVDPGRWLWSGFLQANVATGAVWIVTSPLVAWRFHLVSFAGFFLNVLLGPLVCVLLWSGYLWLVCAALSPTLSEIPLRVFEIMLQALIWITQRAAELQCSHVYVAGPPGWWTAGYYALLAWGALGPHAALRKWIGHGLLGWINIGLAWTLWVPAAPPGLVCEVLAVGHGLTVVTHCPNGRTLVYDAGSLIGPDVAAEAACGSLWRHGQRHVDALVASHADIDHTNGIPLVADRTAPGTLLCHRSFLDFSQEIVPQALDAWSANGGRVRLVAAGDQVLIDPQVDVRFLHPPADFAGSRDNVNSLVVLIEYAGRRILLTGDLERDGLAALLSMPRQPVDVLLAPHHGSKAANPPAWAAWANPEWVTISASDRRVEGRLAESYAPPMTLLNTANRGMIRCEIRPNGELRTTTYR
jgi:competence protein ComEC